MGHKKEVKRFIVRKYVMAHNAKDAIKKEKLQLPDDVYLDDSWRQMQDDINKAKIGY